MSEDFGNEATREVLVRGRRLLSGPTLGVTNKFVVIEAEAWFLPLEEGEATPPTLAEMLLAVLDGDLEDDGFVEEVDARLEDGRLLLGYVRESGEVEIHSLVGAPNSAMRARIRDVFGCEVGTIGNEPAGEEEHPGPEGER